MALGFRKFVSEVLVNGKFPKILPSENFPLYGNLYLYVFLNFKEFSRYSISYCHPLLYCHKVTGH